MSLHIEQDFEVMIKRRNIVYPAQLTVEHRLPLSNLDLILPPEDVCIFLCYQRSSESETIHYHSWDHLITKLKEALAQTLVHFKVFSGELAQNPTGELEIMCNNKGVEFTEAWADIELCDLNLYKPDQSVQPKLVPRTKHGLLSTQVTKLKNGGIIVGLSFDHRVADGYSANMFLMCWAEVATSKPISMLPSFNKSLLNPRHPLSPNPCINDMYISPPPTNKNYPLVSRIYHVNAKEIRRLQSQTMTTKLVSFSAFIWKMISKHACMSKDDAKICKMGIVVDGRTRLSHEEGDEMSRYFGNVVSLPFSEYKAEELSEKPLEWIGERVQELLKKGVTMEHFQDLIDWVEAHRPEPTLAKIYTSGRDDGPAFVVSSGLRFSFSKMEFGWGKPVFGSYHFPWNGNAGYVMPMPSSTKIGDWVVYMLLTKGQLDFLEKEASHVLKPFKLATTCDFKPSLRCPP